MPRRITLWDGSAEVGLEPEQPVLEPGRRCLSQVSYWWPDWDSPTRDRWAQILRLGDSLGYVILDREDGNGWPTYDARFHEQGRRALARGARAVLFYVKTQFAAASLPASDPGRVGVTDADRYTHEYILGLLDACQQHYPDVFGGVFLDEVVTGLSTTAGRIGWYRDLTDGIRARYGPRFQIVANTVIGLADEMLDLEINCFMLVENTADRYITGDGLGRVVSERLRAEPPTRLWHTVHGVTRENVEQVIAKAESLPVGHLYLTDGVLVPRPGQVVGTPLVSQYADPPSAWLRQRTLAWARRAATPGGAISLGATTPVPDGTTAGTIILRRD